jgi:hypothetical protein
MQNNTATLLILLYAAFPMAHALTVLIWALRQRKRGLL